MPNQAAFVTRSLRGTVAAAGLVTCCLSSQVMAQAESAEPDKESAIGKNALGISSTPDAQASTFLGQQLSITLGVGPVIAPAYEGAKKFRPGAFPFVDVQGLFNNRVFLSTTRGLGANLLEIGHFRAGLAVGYGGGRNHNVSPRLRGLSNVTGGPSVSGFMTYDLKPVSFELKLKNTFGPNPGAEASFGMNYAFTPMPRWHLSIGPEVTWADRRYDKVYFGVSPLEAARAKAQGNPMRAYRPGSGIKDVSLSITSVYQWSEHWGLVGHVGLAELVGHPATHSPLTQRRVQPSFAFGGVYRF